MIHDYCDIEFKNKEIEKEVIIPCNDIVTEELYCEQGNLVGNNCVSYSCPDDFEDNGSNCRKEVQPIEDGIVLRAVRLWTGGAYGSRVIFVRRRTNALVDISEVFSNFQRVGSFSVVINGVTYTGNQASNISSDSTIIYDDNSDIFSTIIPNSEFTYYSQVIVGPEVEFAFWNNQTYTRNITSSCPEGSTAVGSKCYEFANKTEITVPALVRTEVKSLIPVPQTVKVEYGEVTSKRSQREADELAKKLLNDKIRNLQPICKEPPIYYNDKRTKIDKKPCVSGIPCNITVSVPANTFSSTISKEDANNKADLELERLFNLSVPCCIDTPTVKYLSQSKEYVYRKSCTNEEIRVQIPRGGNINFRGIMIPLFESELTQEDANNKRESWFTENKSLFEDLLVCPENPPVVQERIKWKVSVSDNGSGQTSPIGERIVNDNSEFFFSAIPNSGYEIDSVTINGEPVSISNTTNYSNTIVIRSNTVIVVKYRKLNRNSSLTLNMDVYETINQNSVRIAYTINQPTGVLVSSECPCSPSVKGEIGYYSPSGSPILPPLTGPVTIANYRVYGGSCGSTGCVEGQGLGVVPIKPETTQIIRVVNGASSFVRWEYTFGTLLGSNNNPPLLSSTTSPILNIFIPEGCDLNLKAIFK